jgi:hypothetical protein
MNLPKQTSSSPLALGYKAEGSAEIDPSRDLPRES